MTMTATATAEPLWARVRTALGAMRAERMPAYGQAAMARSIGIRPKLGQLIDDAMAQGWAAAAGRHVSLSLLVIEIDRSAEYFAAYGEESIQDCLHTVLDAINQHLQRPDDRCLRLGRAGFVVVMPDLPALMARATADKINAAVRDLMLAHKESHAGLVTVSLGLAVCNPRGSYDRKFFEAGAAALKKAQRKGIGRLQVIDLRPAQQRRRKAA
jgi:diguanylate cyclase (GGDEF)-like protein